MLWMKSTFGKHPAGCLWRIRWETKSCIFLQFCFFFNKTCFRQETCLGDFAKIWMILRLKSLLETKCLKFRTPSFCPPRYQRALLCEFLEGLTNQRQKHAIYDNRVKSPLFNSLMSSLPPGR